MLYRPDDGYKVAETCSRLIWCLGDNIYLVVLMCFILILSSTSWCPPCLSLYSMPDCELGGDIYIYIWNITTKNMSTSSCTNSICLQIKCQKDSSIKVTNVIFSELQGFLWTIPSLNIHSLAWTEVNVKSICMYNIWLWTNT